jgi:flagellar protein FliS
MTTLRPPSVLAAQYRRTGVESQVIEADPHKLIALMLRGAIQRVQLAAASIGQGDAVRKAKAASEAGAIVDALSACLDEEAGGEIASGLAALYDYAARRIASANAQNDPEGFREVEGLLGEVEGAWLQIRPAAGA